jgi:hypothetical protein
MITFLKSKKSICKLGEVMLQYIVLMQYPVLKQVFFLSLQTFIL